MIRVKAVMVIEHDGRFLFEESYDRVKDEKFYMPFGGGVEFGESTLEAALREVREELGISVPEPDLLGVKENRFVFEGKQGHDIVFVYHSRLSRSFDPNSIEVEVHQEQRLVPVWLTEREILSSPSPFYPKGVAELITSLYEIPF